MEGKQSVSDEILRLKAELSQEYEMGVCTDGIVRNSIGNERENHLNRIVFIDHDEDQPYFQNHTATSIASKGCELIEENSGKSITEQIEELRRLLLEDSSSQVNGYGFKPVPPAGLA